MLIDSFKKQLNNILNEVEESLSNADCKNVTWFRKNSLRNHVFNNSYLECKRTSHRLKDDNVEKGTVEDIWGLCHDTALIIFSQLAPLDSYNKFEEAVIRAASFRIYYKEVLEKFPQIISGVDKLREHLCQPASETRETFLCNLYGGLHVFVIEKHSPQSCFIYQSYANTYSFKEFLEDESKHISWNSQRLIQSLTEITSESLPMNARISRYKELFFFSPRSLELVTRNYQEHQLVFVKTETYG